MKVHTPSGEIPLLPWAPSPRLTCRRLLTRQDMENSIDVYGLPGESRRLSHHGQRGEGSEGHQASSRIPDFPGGGLEAGGKSFAALMSALMVGMVLLYFSLVRPSNRSSTP